MKKKVAQDLEIGDVIWELDWNTLTIKENQIGEKGNPNSLIKDFDTVRFWPRNGSDAWMVIGLGKNENIWTTQGKVWFLNEGDAIKKRKSWIDSKREHLTKNVEKAEEDLREFESQYTKEMGWKKK